jgi:hypothetical protein
MMFSMAILFFIVAEVFVQLCFHIYSRCPEKRNRGHWAQVDLIIKADESINVVSLYTVRAEPITC